MGLFNIFVNTNSRPISSGNPFANSVEHREPGKLLITPWRQVWRMSLKKILNSRNSISRAELKLYSKNSNTRCLDCGWKYNFNMSTCCPACQSEKAYLLTRGIFLNDLLSILLVFIAMFSLILLAYKSVINQ